MSSVLIFGVLRGMLRFLSQAALAGSSRAHAFLTRALRSDTLFRGIIHRLAVADLGGKTPDKVYAESTNACNARCVMCNRDTMQRKVGIMEYGLFEHIANQYAELGGREMRFHNFGEPMIDPKLPQKVAYAKRLGIPSTVMYTNGSLLTEKMARDLMQAGLDALYVSFDGGTRESYERIRVGLSFEQVSNNVVRLMRLRSQMQAGRPFVELVLLPIDNDQDDVRRFQQTWKGVTDSVRVSAVHDFAGQGTACSVAVASPVAHKHTKIPCYMPWRSMLVLWNGDVALCCMDFDGTTILGNAQNQPLMEIWHGQPFRRVRGLHLDGDFSSLPLCRSCHVNAFPDCDSKLETLRLWL